MADSSEQRRKRHWDLLATQRALSHRIHFASCHAYNTWVERVARRIYAHRLRRHCTLRVLGGAWDQMAARAQARRVTRHRLLGAITRMRHGALGRAWLSWVEAARAALSGLYARVAGRLLHRKLALGWHTWRFLTDAAAARDATRRAALFALFHQALARGFRSWRAASDALFELRRAAAVLYGSWHDREVAAALRMWHENVHRCTPQNAPMILP